MRGEPDALHEEIMTKGMAVHYAPDVLADAEKLHNVWASQFTKTRSWRELPTTVRVAWCEVVLAARKMPKAP